MIAQMRHLIPVITFALLIASLLPYSLGQDVTTPDANASREFSADELMFFEQKIRPVLEKHCVECHSDQAAKSNKLKGGLRIDSRQALLQGGESGPAVVPGKPDDSLLLKAMRYESLEMPPKGRLPTTIIADFERWIATGAADPRSPNALTTVSKGIDLVKGRQHWPYRQIQRQAIPQPKSSERDSLSPIDDFVLARLESENLARANPADRVSLIRRVSFDLIGLPPSPEEIDEFLTDAAPDSFERLVDRLMASPHFGARWGRHWLSVARFGESVTLRGLIFAEAWRYRDYVIDSFNADRPFDQFVIEQLAGDLLPAETLPDRQRKLIATTFLSLGNHNLEEQDKHQLRMDVVDEQLEAIGKGFLAQTIGCARCHDHKFDPIPTRDYYAMAGILANVQTLEDANVSKWLELPLPLEANDEATIAKHEQTVAAVQKQIETVKAAQQKLQPGSRTVIASKSLPGIVVDDRQAKVVGDWQHSQSIQPYIDEGYLHDKAVGKGQKTITLLPELPKAGQYEVRLAYTADSNRSDAVPVTVMSADGEKTIIVNQKERPPIDGSFVSLGQYRFELNGQGFVIVSTTGTTGHVIVDAVQFLPLEPEPVPSQPTAPASPESDKANQEEVRRLARELQSLQKELKELQEHGPRRPKYMSVRESPKIDDARVHIRGTVHNLGDVVPRGFLQVATAGEPKLPPPDYSGRKELAEWIAGRENPLTPRVLSNRVWSWMFGKGLSRTPDNLGTTGESPTHPELLDWLAVRLMEHDWSVKSLIREIATSQTYTQSSQASDEQIRQDPDNRWLSHHNRRRLDAECLLDAILTVSGQRNDELGGPTIAPGKAEDYSYLNLSSRRAVYWPVLRNSLPEVFDVFDFADPSVSTASRNVSTVASQSLFFMNDEWIGNEGRFAAKRILGEPFNEDSRIDRAFRIVLGRSPTADEIRITGDALSSSKTTEDGWTMVIKALFASIDFRYVE